MNSILRRAQKKPLRAVLTLLRVVLGSLAMTLALSVYLETYTQQGAAQAERFDLIAGYVDEDGLMGSYGLMDAAGVA